MLTVEGEARRYTTCTVAACTSIQRHSDRSHQLPDHWQSWLSYGKYCHFETSVDEESFILLSSSPDRSMKILTLILHCISNSRRITARYIGVSNRRQAHRPRLIKPPVLMSYNTKFPFCEDLLRSLPWPCPRRTMFKNGQNSLLTNEYHRYQCLQSLWRTLGPPVST